MADAAKEIEVGVGTEAADEGAESATRPVARVSRVFGERVRALRSAEGWSLRQLAERVGVSHNQVRLIENGQSGVGLDLADRLARVFGLSLDAMISNEEPSVDLSDALFAEFRREWQLLPNGERKLALRVVRVIREDALERGEVRLEPRVLGSPPAERSEEKGPTRSRRKAAAG